jgi:hypothetical protein
MTSKYPSTTTATPPFLIPALALSNPYNTLFFLKIGVSGVLIYFALLSPSTNNRPLNPTICPRAFLIGITNLPPILSKGARFAFIASTLRGANNPLFTNSSSVNFNGRKCCNNPPGVLGE